MHLLEAVAKPAHKERWLRPLAAGDDPLLLLHDRACAGRRLRPIDAHDHRTPRRRHYVINGGKWFITGADGAAFAIIMANVGGRRRHDVPGGHG